MVHADSRRSKALFVILGVVVIGAACVTSEHATDPTGPTTPSATPTPAPTPTPTPTPKPTPTPSASGIVVKVTRWGSQACKRGVGPTGTEDLRVGCSVEIRVAFEDAQGNNVPQRTTGENIVWTIPEGGANVTLPWDENPWKRWLTGINAGHYTLRATLSMRNGDVISGDLEGDIIP